MINLFVNVYLEENLDRRKELHDCFLRNVFNQQVDRLYILITMEDTVIISNFLMNSKIFVDVIAGRPTYKDFFDYINKYTQDDDINIIANSDIFFDDTILNVNKLKQDECFALSRWEIGKDGLPNHVQVQVRGDSNDTWCFRGNIKHIEYCDFTLGKAGCDNRIAYEIQKAGYKISNPSKTIKTWHLHNSGIRHYIHTREHCVPEPYLTIPLTYLP